MAREPKYPADAAVGSPPAPEVQTGSAQSDAGAGTKPKSGRKRKIGGAAIGIGSGAIMAALLYVGRNRRGGGNDRGKG